LKVRFEKGKSGVSRHDARAHKSYKPYKSYNPTLQTLPCTTYIHTQTTHACAIKIKIKINDYIGKGSLLKRGGVYCPPENLQHWEVAKQQNALPMPSDA